MTLSGQDQGRRTEQIGGRRVPLSEREKKILDEIERGLYTEDPRFGRGARRPKTRAEGPRRLKLGAVLLAAGFLMLIAFFLSQSVLVGVAAFGTMVTGVVLVAGAIPSSTAAHKETTEGVRDRLLSRLNEWSERARRSNKRR